MIDVTTDREKYIGGSEARLIYQGKWLELYREKVEGQKVDLSDVFPVQLGNHTEAFHIQWLIDHQGHEIVAPTKEKPLVYVKDEYRRSHLDAIHASKPQIVEVKHTNSFTDLEAQALQYMAQIQHNIYVADADECLFSCIFGNTEPQTIRIGRNDMFISELLEMEDMFWQCVINKTPPEEIQIEGNVEAHKFNYDDMREVDMEAEGSNAWANSAVDYLNNQEAAATFEASKKDLKALVAKDVRLAKGNGVQIKRDKRGALRFSTYD